MFSRNPSQSYRTFRDHRRDQACCGNYNSHVCDSWLWLVDRKLKQSVFFQRPALPCCQQAIYDSWEIVSCHQLGEDFPDRVIISPFQYVALGYTPLELIIDLNGSNDIS